ncbi:hypothetical protein [Chitinimonas lacunae]|uniref:NlpC/P60 domain-containing protein n=1 Tax=Chitinimonas lacunae TaxID=1963018 RepID=A0ABV8MVJ1_9NEIS
MPITQATLQGYVDQTIGDICGNNYAPADANHCAHFVSHVLNLAHGTLCGDMQYSTRRTGASIRCNELYNSLNSRGPWADRPTAADGLLIFVLSARNVVGNVMGSVPQKHVGIHFGGKVYHYSNSQDKVVCDPTVEAFHNKFKHAYAGNDISLYYGVVA